MLRIKEIKRDQVLTFLSNLFTILGILGVLITLGVIFYKLHILLFTLYISGLLILVGWFLYMEDR